MTFSLEHRSTSEPSPEKWTDEESVTRLDDTTEAWRTWSALHQAYEGPWRDLVHHSGRVLYGLTYYPTGAICAAPTTSLPESPGGARNWDYRYTWVRDASFTLSALWVAACPDEAEQVLRLSLERGREPGPSGRRPTDHVRYRRRARPQRAGTAPPAGWRNSAPVRVGNGAWNQRQIDVYGEMLAALARLPGRVRTARAPRPAGSSPTSPNRGRPLARARPRHLGDPR